MNSGVSRTAQNTMKLVISFMGLFCLVISQQASAAQSVSWATAISARVGVAIQPDAVWRGQQMPDCKPAVAIVEDYEYRGLRDICYVTRGSCVQAAFRR